MQSKKVFPSASIQLDCSGAGEPKCKEAKASAAAAAEVPEFPAATTSAAAEFPAAAKFPKLPATAKLPAAAAADLSELWCTTATAAAKVFNAPVCTACRVCPPTGLWGKGSKMLDLAPRSS